MKKLNKPTRIALIYGVLFITTSPFVTWVFLQLDLTKLSAITPFFIIYFAIFLAGFTLHMKKLSKDWTFAKLLSQKNLQKIAMLSLVIGCGIWVMGSVVFSDKINFSYPLSSADPTRVIPDGRLIMTHEKGSEIILWEMDVFLSGGVSAVTAGTYSAYIEAISGAIDCYSVDSASIGTVIFLASIIPATVSADGTEILTYPSAMSAYSDKYIIDNEIGFGMFTNLYEDSWDCYEIWSDYDSGGYITSQTESVSLECAWILKPTVVIDSEYYTSQNIRIEVFDKVTDSWIDQDPNELSLVHPEYKLRIYDINTNNLIFEDSTYNKFKTTRTVTIDSIKLENNSGENVNFTASQENTNYYDGNYIETADTVTMDNGTKDGSDYTVLDASDSNRLVMDCNSEQSSAQYNLANYTETADSISMTEGTDSGALTNYDTDDDNYVEFDPEANIVWSTSTWDSYDSGSGAGTYTSWTGTYADWDEVWYSDADYISEYVSPSSSSDESIAMGNSALTTTYRLDAVEVEVRYRITDWQDVGISVYIYIDGTWDYVTSCGTATSWTTKTMTETYGSGNEDIADYNNMQVRVTASGEPLGSGGTGYISCVRTRAKYSYIESNTYDLDGYTEFDYSDLGVSGNITDRDDIETIGLNYKFYSSVVGTDVTCSAYNWDTSQWTELTDTSPTSETAYSDYTLSNSYLKDDENDLLFRFRVEASETTDFLTYFEVLTVELEYYNHNDPYYDYYHELDSTIQWDYTDIGGDMADREDITSIELKYSYFSNISQDINVYAYDWTNTEWDILTVASHTTLTLITNTSLDYNYFKNDVGDLLFKLRITGSYIEQSNSGFDCEWDLVTCDVTFTNKSDSYLTYTDVLSTIVSPYTFSLNNLTDVYNYTVFMYDIYDNDLGNESISFTDYVEVEIYFSRSENFFNFIQ